MSASQDPSQSVCERPLSQPGLAPGLRHHGRWPSLDNQISARSGSPRARITLLSLLRILF